MDADETAREFGVYAHGPDAAKVADRFVEQIWIWDRTTGTVGGRA